ncbi:nucleotide exchange factor GrpE [Candidatus Poriferisocius sp.]|uniref:nucleotide exchange factor GrpE n=1 Tax=Candidatus Poriferisocius sp. TaxID=3101276 RepID=UPI003B0297F3
MSEVLGTDPPSGDRDRSAVDPPAGDRGRSAVDPPAGDRVGKEPAADPSDRGRSASEEVAGQEVAAEEVAGQEVVSEKVMDRGEPLPSVEELLAQRDGYLNDLQRVTAEFANYRRKAAERQQDTVAMAAADMAEKILPVLDACEAAVAQGAEDVVPIRDALFGALEREGLARVGDLGEAFDPNCHEAVVHEPGDGGAVITEVLRAGYRWNSRVLRPAMVKVRG